MTQIFNPTAELAMSLGIPAKEAKTEIGIYPVKEKLKKVVAQCNLKPYKLFYTSYI